MGFWRFSFSTSDIERFSDRYREKKKEELEWQPGKGNFHRVLCLMVHASIQEYLFWKYMIINKICLFHSRLEIISKWVKNKGEKTQES